MFKGRAVGFLCALLQEFFFFFEFGIEEPPYFKRFFESKGVFTADCNPPSLLGAGTSDLSVNISKTQMIPCENQQVFRSQGPYEMTHNLHNIPQCAEPYASRRFARVGVNFFIFFRVGRLSFFLERSLFVSSRK